MPTPAPAGLSNLNLVAATCRLVNGPLGDCVKAEVVEDECAEQDTVLLGWDDMSTAVMAHRSRLLDRTGIAVHEVATVSRFAVVKAYVQQPEAEPSEDRQGLFSTRRTLFGKAAFRYVMRKTPEFATKTDQELDELLGQMMTCAELPGACCRRVAKVMTSLSVRT